MTRISRLFPIVLILMVQWVQAQSDLIVQGSAPQLYLVHKVMPKENWYSVGRTYNLSPKEIAPFNGATLEQPLSIGQLLKIPLTATNFSQDGVKAGDEVFVPVKHIVQEKEWMYRISQSHNKVPVANLEKWNNITNDHLRQGMKLTIGYLKVKMGQSSLASGGLSAVPVAATASVAAPAPPPAHTEPVKTEPVVTTTPAKPEPVKTEPIKTEPVKTELPKADPPKVEPKPVVKEEPKAPVTTTTTNTDPDYNKTPANFKGGYFRTQYSETNKGTAGNAGVFRSTSGWQDGKYYALMNNVPVGTIVKVSFSSTNKSIYAKVLGQLPDMKESVGLIVRISDAAASELGASNGKFYVDVKY